MSRPPVRCARVSYGVREQERFQCLACAFERIARSGPDARKIAKRFVFDGGHMHRAEIARAQ